MTTKTPKTKIHSIWFIILSIIGGNLCMGCAYSVFVLPHNIVSGGSGGMGVVLRGMFGIDPTIFVTVMMWVMFFLGLIFLGKSFSLKTLPSTFLYPASVYLFNCIKPLQAWTLTLDNTLLAAIFAGALYGIGSALIFKTGGSSGGTDIPALIVEKYTGWPFEKLIFAEDVIIIGAGVFFVGFEPALIGIVLCFISMETIDRIMFGGSTCMLIFIMTTQLDAVNDYILKELNRGTTIVPCIGGYTKKPRQMIQAVVSRNEYNLVLHYVHEVDPKAFITIVNAKETLGEGFKEPGIKRLKGK
ncbi:MAG: YitT family protein [Bacilli bacterium]|nr:YitT family protein [Bacilli bacterium]